MEEGKNWHARLEETRELRDGDVLGYRIPEKKVGLREANTTCCNTLQYYG
jgi:hypothetical protein